MEDGSGKEVGKRDGGRHGICNQDKKPLRHVPHNKAESQLQRTLCTRGQRIRQTKPPQTCRLGKRIRQANGGGGYQVECKYLKSITLSLGVGERAEQRHELHRKRGADGIADDSNGVGCDCKRENTADTEQCALAIGGGQVAGGEVDHAVQDEEFGDAVEGDGVRGRGVGARKRAGMPDAREFDGIAEGGGGGGWWV
jgi:hypothetical protein